MNEEYDQFFDRVCNDYHSLVKRSALYLQWRYFDCPDANYHFFAIRKWGKLVGWSVFALKDDTLVWGDALFERRFESASPLLIDHVQKNVFPGIYLF